MTIHIQTYGKGKPVVFFHGWGFDSSIWHSLLPRLEKDYQVYLVDLPGFGGSTLLGWEDFKSELLKRLPKHFALLGWSLGGLFATRLAIEAPFRVTQVFNIASSPKFIREEDWPGVEARVFDAFYKNLSRNLTKTLNQFVALQLKGERGITRLSEKEPSQRSLENGLNILLDWDLRRQLHDLTMPVCYGFGRLDAITPQATFEVMSIDFPTFRYELFEQSAHVPFFSERTLFIKILKDFLL